MRDEQERRCKMKVRFPSGEELFILRTKESCYLQYQLLKSLIRLVNYFRNDIRSHSQHLKPLQDLLAQSFRQGNSKLILIWSQQAENSFIQIKDYVHSCPLFFLLNETAPIFLHTDASDYAIGAYLFQVVEEKKQPIQIYEQISIR